MKLFRLIQSLVLALGISFLLSFSAYAAKMPWTTLTPMQKEALAPIAQQWDTLPDKQQKRLLATTKRYPKLSPNEKQLFLTRLTDWSKLTPEQRDRAREKYKAFSKLAPEKREEVKKMVMQSEAEKMAAAASSVERIPEVSEEEQHR
jgi:hypothetical protein